MAVHFIEDTRIEELAEKLVAELKSERAEKGRFEFLKVSVANPNLGNWLKMKVLAKVPELSAGVEMPFLTEELERILRENGEPGLEIVSGRDYPLLILNILMKEGREEFAPFCKYVKEEHYQPGPLTIISQREARRAVRLANRLGQLIDDYEATDYLSLLGEQKGEGEVYRGEAALIDAMQNVSSLRKVFDSVKDRPPRGPAEKIILFGHTSLTSIQKEMLEWVARTHEVIWFQPMVGMRAQEGVSVCVADAPGIRREVEMVHEKILNAVWDHNEDGTPIRKEDVSFSDIAVLVTDMPKYRSMIESVFEERGQIPYGLVDATTRDYSTYLDGFLALMDIARYGLNRTRLFAALDNPCVQRAMGFSREDVVAWRTLADRLGAYEGFDPADSDEGNVSGRFNWAWALQRLRLGLVANTLDGLPLEALAGDSAERFSEVVETLHRSLSALNGTRALCSSRDEKTWPSTWAGMLHTVMDQFLVIDADDSVEAIVRAQIVRILNGLTVIEGEQSYRLPVAVVEDSVAGMECAKGGYLRHGVTIGGLRSLAHVPFKRIFVIGLSEGAIPTRDSHSTLDVRSELTKEERIEHGETLASEEDRARFMAAVSSAREELVLSYPRIDLQTDEKLYPSPLVAEAAGSSVVVEHVALIDGRPCPEDARIAKPESCASEKVELGMPTAKDFAALVKDPLHAVLTRRFKIAESKGREKEVAEASPLGVGGEMTRYALEEAAVAQTLDAHFETAQMQGAIPVSFLGEFVKKKMDGVADWAKASVHDEDRLILKGGGAGRGIAVICRRFNRDDEKNPITIPPSCVLVPLYRELTRFVSSGRAGEFTFRVRVVALEQWVATWEWRLQGETVEQHLSDLRKWYGEIPPTIGRAKEHSPNAGVETGYDALRKTLCQIENLQKDAFSWDDMAQKLGLPGSGTVIDQSLNRWRRPPTGAELKRMYDQIFKVAMSGTMMTEESEGQHE